MSNEVDKAVEVEVRMLCRTSNSRVEFIEEHMTSKNELTSDEKDTIRRSTEPTTITTANGKAQSTEEAAVYAIDLDVVVTMMLLEDSAAVLSFGFIVEEMTTPMNGKGESLHH